MSDSPRLVTERLLLRPWKDADREPFAAMNADPEVMRYFESTQPTAASDAFVDRINAGFVAEGFGLWAVEIPGAAAFIGFTGIHRLPPGNPHAGKVEVGWRLAASAWGKGYATEAARAAVEYGFEVAGLDEIVSMTAVLNKPSRAVMERLGMTRDPDDDFDHPAVAGGNPMRRHVLYRLSNPGRADRGDGRR